MDVSSVSSSVYSAITANSQTQTRNSLPEGGRSAQQSQQATQTQNSQQAQNQKTVATQSKPPVSESESVNRAQAASENARPTVNTSGQAVGTRVNTTA